LGGGTKRFDVFAFVCVVAYVLQLFYEIRAKLWERAESLGKKTGTSHRRGELKRFVSTI
jgi:hypothetical protein